MSSSSKRRIFALLVFSSIFLTAASTLAVAPDQKAEQLLEKKVNAGEEAELAGGTVSAVVLGDLLKRLQQARNVRDVSIVNARISGALVLEQQEIAFNITLRDCIFDGDVNFSGTKFQKGLSLRGSTFNGGANFYHIQVAEDLRINKANFISAKQVNFDAVTVKGVFHLYQSKFNGPVLMSNAEMKSLECAGTDDEIGPAEFRNAADFYGMKVNGDANFTDSIFVDKVNFGRVVITADLELSKARFDSRSNPPELFDMKIGANLLLNKAQFAGGFDFARSQVAGKLEMREASATGDALKDFSTMRVDTLSLDTIPAPLSLDMVEYRLFNWDDDNKALQLVEASSPNRRAFADLEAYFRRIGSFDMADKVYFAAKSDERRKLSGFSYFRSWFLWITVGYGKRPWLALVWSLGFIALGRFVFFRKAQMMPKPREALLCGDYNPLWYSTALFLPIVDLGDQKEWVPKHRLSQHYRRVHIIFGYLLIPIGLAAWTGLIH